MVSTCLLLGYVIIHPKSLFPGFCWLRHVIRERVDFLLLQDALWCALDVCGFKLKTSEISFLEQHSQSCFDADYVDYLPFVASRMTRSSSWRYNNNNYNNNNNNNNNNNYNNNNNNNNRSSLDPDRH